jgi:hypothetical protein
MRDGGYLPSTNAKGGLRNWLLKGILLSFRALASGQDESSHHILL